MHHTLSGLFTLKHVQDYDKDFGNDTHQAGVVSGSSSLSRSGKEKGVLLGEEHTLIWGCIDDCYALTRSMV